MYTENGLIADIEEVRKVVEHADVLGIGFRLFGERLLIDTRSHGQEGSFIGVVAPLGSVQERIFWLGQHRPRFGMPQRFAFFFWPNSVRFFEDTGVWGAIRERVLVAGPASAPADAERAISDLRRLEREAQSAAITGGHHRTLWQSQTSRHNG